MKTCRSQIRSHSKRGTALAAMILVVTSLAMLSAMMLSVTLAGSREVLAHSNKTSADYVCQAGLSQAMYQLQRGQPGSVGSQATPLDWGGGSFWVEATAVGGDLLQLRCDALARGRAARQELVVRSRPDLLWQWSIFGKESVTTDSGVKIDSYDSALGTYASQVTGAAASAHAHSAGNVGSNGAIDLENSKVFGNVSPGPGHSVRTSGSSISGLTTPALSPIALPAINVPTFPSFGSLNAGAGTLIPSGNAAYDSIRVNGTLTITGPANLVVRNLSMASNSSIRIDDTNGPVTLTVIDDFMLDSNSRIYPISLVPANLRLNILSDNVIDPEVTVQLDRIGISSNSTIYGLIYAPDAAIRLDSNFTLYGSLMARSLDLDSNCTFHFDESLLGSGAGATLVYETVAWRELPAAH